ncbi:MAG: Beta-galactosidase C-terminal domain, partial [Bacteroidota bacterium]
GDMSKESFLKASRTHGRDHARTPILWEDSPFAGFSKAEPWIKVSEDYPEINVQKSIGDKNSVFNFYKKLMELRKENLCWVYGQTEVLKDLKAPLYGYYRKDGDGIFLILLNFSAHTQNIELNVDQADLIISNYDQLENPNVMRAWESRVFKY